MPPLYLEGLPTLDGNREEKKTIPKFASFRAKQASPARTDDRRQPRFEARPYAAVSRATSVDKPKAHIHLSKRCHSRGNHEQRDAKEEPYQNLQRSGKTDDAHSEESSRLYAIDKIGDPKNLVFGALDQYATPSFSRFGAGDVLGSCMSHKIDRAASSEKGLVLSYAENGQRRERDRKASWRASQTSTREWRIRPQSGDSTAFGHQVDFVAFEDAVRAKRRRANDGPSLPSPLDSDERVIRYESVVGKAGPENITSDEDLACASDASLSSAEVRGGAPAEHSSIQNTRIGLSRRVGCNRESADVWLELIKYQDKVLIIDSQKHNLTAAERRSNAEIKLSMYEKALHNVKDPKGGEVLLIGKLKEAIRVWHSQKVLSEWQKALRDNPCSLMLWTGYLDFNQTAFATFRYEDVQEIYKNCLTRLKSVPVVPSTRLAQSEELYMVQVYVTLRMTLFMRESGFGEQAVAAWQALLEYEFFRPSDLNDPDSKQGGSSHGMTASRFERFWDSEVPRIGEEGSKGWFRFDPASGEYPQPKIEMANHREDCQNHWDSWVKTECRQGLLARNPARTIDEVVENDPYGVILFSDISLFLINAPSVASRNAPLDAFLAFCHLPPYREDGSFDRHRCWWREGFVRNETLNRSSNALQWFRGWTAEEEIIAKQPNTTSFERSLFESPAGDFLLSPDTLFAVSWFSAFKAWCINYAEDRGPLEKAWILRTLGQLVSAGIGGDSLAEYSLALELCLSPETVKKTARGLLKKRTSSLQLYNTYALIEYRLGHAGDGEKALMTSLKMCKTLDKAAQWSSILLWRTWVWELLIVGNTGNALKVMLMLGEEEAHSNPSFDILSETRSVRPALLLRTESALTATRDNLLSIGQYRYATAAIDCLILLNYLKSSLSLSAATSVFKSNLLRLSRYISPIGSAHELLHQSFARLLYYHATQTRLVKPSDIRSLLAESINLFPQNTIFLSLYAWNEARFRVDDRIRSIFRDVVLAKNQDARSKRQESVIPHFSAIHCELSRSVTFGSNISTIRSTFERAVESQSGAHCAGLWKLYFAFELSRGENASAKCVFWRGVKACPWVKDLYLLAFEYLRGADGLRNEELRGVYELLIEKELRIHTSLKEDFDVIEEKKTVGKI